MVITLLSVQKREPRPWALRPGDWLGFGAVPGEKFTTYTS